MIECVEWLSTAAFLEFLTAATWTRIVASNLGRFAAKGLDLIGKKPSALQRFGGPLTFQRVARRLQPLVVQLAHRVAHFRLIPFIRYDLSIDRDWFKQHPVVCLISMTDVCLLPIIVYFVVFVGTCADEGGLLDDDD